MRPLVLIHGYSDRGKSYRTWADALKGKVASLTHLYTCDYESLSNEITIRDLAEGFDRALSDQAGLADGQEFDAIVHSTGMLVLRSWLSTYAARRRRLKHLIALAPATFGSPLAHKGRSWLGAVFKGNRTLGADFLEAGDQILDGLELASTFTWDLAHLDLIVDEPVYGVDADTPYVFNFCGLQSYDGIRRLVSEAGTDGTVRWAGCALNTRKLVVDLTEVPDADGTGSGKRVAIFPKVENDPDNKPIDARVLLLQDMNHATILQKPSEVLIDLVTSALGVHSADELKRWSQKPSVKEAVSPAQSVPRWQQFVVRALDERGDPIPDYHLQMFSDSQREGLKEFDADVHVYSGDKSYRCFHVRIDSLLGDPSASLRLRIMASSGSSLVGYQGFGSERALSADGRRLRSGKWDATLDLGANLAGTGFRLFFPYTTTLIELRLNREPLPLTGQPTIFTITPQTVA